MVKHNNKQSTTESDEERNPSQKASAPVSARNCNTTSTTSNHFASGVVSGNPLRKECEQEEISNNNNSSNNLASKNCFSSNINGNPGTNCTNSVSPLSTVELSSNQLGTNSNLSRNLLWSTSSSNHLSSSASTQNPSQKASAPVSNRNCNTSTTSNHLSGGVVGGNPLSKECEQENLSNGNSGKSHKRCFSPNINGNQGLNCAKSVSPSPSIVELSQSPLGTTSNSSRSQLWSTSSSNHLPNSASHQNPSQKASAPVSSRNCNTNSTSNHLGSGLVNSNTLGKECEIEEIPNGNSSNSKSHKNHYSPNINGNQGSSTVKSVSPSCLIVEPSLNHSRANPSLNRNHLWSTNSTNHLSNSASGNVVSTGGPHLPSPGLPPRVATPAPGLSHSSLHSNHGLNMFAPPIPAPPVSLSSVGGAAAPTATPSPFMGDSLFPPPNQDLLRRELDTRFLASHDRSINIPPPPYMRSEMHQHSHIHHSTTPYGLQPSLGASLVPPSAAHLYDKFPKLDSAFYARSALGLTGFPSLSQMIAPGTPNQSAGSISSAAGGPVGGSTTPFGPPGHLAAFQPKSNLLTPNTNKSKAPSKSGRWCAMHVRIAWEIYHHQTKQPHLESSHKLPTTSSGPTTNSKSGHHPSDILRPLNNLFTLPPRPHEMPSFSSSLLSAAAGHGPQRPPLDPALAHHTGYGPNPLSVHPYIRPGYPSFANFPGLGALGLPGAPNAGASLFGTTPPGPGARDISAPGVIPGLGPGMSDPWARASSTPRTTPSFYQTMTPPSSSSSSLNSAGWGGLKAEAEREMNQEELEKQRKNMEDGRRMDGKMDGRGKSDDKFDGKHKESHHNTISRYSHSNIDGSLRNGDVPHEHRREWEKGYKRELSRSPLNHHPNKMLKTDSSSAFNNDKSNDIKVKEERKENSLSHSQVDKSDRSKVHNNNNNSNNSGVESGINSKHSTASSLISPSLPIQVSTQNTLNSSASLAAMSLSNPLERARLMGLFGLHGPPPVPPHLGHGGNPSDPLKSFWGPFFPPPAHHPDPFKSLHELPARPDFLEREHLLQRYNILNSSGGGAPLTEKLMKDGPLHSLMEKDLREKETLASLEKHKLGRSSDLGSSIPSSFSSGLPPPHGAHLPPPPPSALFPPNPYLNSLHTLSASAGSNVRVKTHSNPSSASSSSSSSSSSSKSSPSPQSSSKSMTVPTNGITAPPPLIPSMPTTNNANGSQKLFSTKISVNSLIENSLESVKELSRGRDRTSISNPSTPAANGTNNVTEVGESQSR